MKKYLVLLAFLLVITQIGVAQSKNYGKKVEVKNAITVQQLVKNMNDKSEVNATVTGKVSSVCQAEGCWMKVDKGDGTAMMVTMKDHKFFVPKDINGKTAVFIGNAIAKTTSVAMLKHYAEDEGKSADYIASIKEPKTELSFEATGVLIK